VLDDIAGFEWDSSTFKVDWALDRPIEWAAPECRQAGTVHLADDLNHLSDMAHAIATHRVPARPFCVVGQQSMTDPSRMPPGTETAWAYAHLPRRIDSDNGPDNIRGDRHGDDSEAFAARIEAQIETYAPGFGRTILGRHLFTPTSMEGTDPNLDGGALAGGTTKLHQELVFRPIPGLARPETPIAGLYLASASAHPGGGVHGACGRNAARAALLHARIHQNAI
jgi:phytoene dehydrogenase-like protein